jgi:hypothetical protein
MTPYELRIVQYADKIRAKALNVKRLRSRGRPPISIDKQQIIARLRQRTSLTIQQIAEYCAVSIPTAFKYADRCHNVRRTPGSLTVDRRQGALMAKSAVRRKSA